jgi:hypothetical protein
MLDAAADFVYVRLHGDVRIYTSGYSDSALAGWTRRIRRWARDGRDVYVYFDNDVKVRAPFDALALMRRLGCAWPPGTPGEHADLPRHAPDARIPRVSVRYGPRVTGGGAWVALRRGGSRQLARGASLTVSGRPTSRAGGRTARRSSSTGRMFSTSAPSGDPRRAM